MTGSRAGRPRASSREVLAEAACELFLEQGFDATSIADIATRAGVSRSSFFNYASSKSGLLWDAFDERIDALAASLDDAPDDPRPLAERVLVIAEGLRPDALALALANAEAMAISADLERESAVRTARIAQIAATAARRGGAPSMSADIHGAAVAGAVMSALRHWADAGPGARPLRDVVAEALALVPDMRP